MSARKPSEARRNISAATMDDVAATLDALAKDRGDRTAVLAILKSIRGSSWAADRAWGQSSVLAPHATLVDSETIAEYANEWRAMAEKTRRNAGREAVKR